MHRPSPLLFVGVLAVAGCGGKSAPSAADVAEQRAAKMCACKNAACIDAVEKQYEGKLDGVVRLRGDERSRALQAITRAIDCGVRASGIGVDTRPAPATAKRPKPAGPYLIALRDSKLVLVDVHAPGTQRLVDTGIKARVTSALVVDHGNSVLIVAAFTELWRYTPGRPAQKLLTSKRSLQLQAASAGGRVVVAGHGLILEVGPRRATLVDLKPPRAVHTRVGAISADGQRVLSSFIPSETCHERPKRRQVDTLCAFEVWGIDRRGGTWKRIAASKLHSYNGIFMPGRAADHIVFEVPQPDRMCASRPLWGCGVENLYRIRFDGSRQRLLLDSAWVPRYSPDGKWMSASSPWKNRQALLVGPASGPWSKIASDCHYALRWSGDSEWIAYQPVHGKTKIIRRDGTNGADAGEGQPIGFLMAVPNIGQAVPATPTKDDHLASMLRAYQTHKTNAEPFAMMGVASTVGQRVPASMVRFSQPTQLDNFMGRGQRVLAVVSSAALCELDRRFRPRNRAYAVLTQPDKPYVLITNRLGPNETDLNRLPATIRRARPASVGTAVNANFDDRVELVGVDLPASVQRGGVFRVTLHYRVVKPMRGDWSTFVHFDGHGVRFQGDHKVSCGTRRWRPGDWIVDSFEVEAVTNIAGQYKVYTGFYQGSHGSWRNLTAKAALPVSNGRVPVGRISVR